ncbi:hypothetical protein O5O45_09380 [Hahella aquimaris]|uniref:hypothetical protein n=1 Tax=Hahella sp. HNIBRBA332 TaxID=3015983 RepID=UPI00273B11AC|nr:hypothetical protein [Hahella sp. HNIBRBA332]WLQ16125.1 hypothetical protein O5O45_09380 [Hahella sp. HNIBRBA332]
MADVYIAKQGDPIRAMANDFPANNSMTMQQRMDYVMEFNKDLIKTPTFPRNDLVILNQDVHCNPILRNEYQSLRTQLQCMPDAAFNGIAELGGNESIILIQAIMEFLKDQDWYSHAGDLNTFGGAGLGATATRTEGFVKALNEIEVLLEQYGKAPNLQKAKLKTQINNAYKELNQRFGNIMQRYIGKASANHARHPAYSSRRAMKLASRGRYMTLTGSTQGRQITSGLKALNYVGKGLVFLDLGLRARNIYLADNRYRQTMMEAAGFGASFYVGYIGGLYALSLALGPLGWIIAIIVIGAAAVSLDYMAKYAAGNTYDFVDMQFQNYRNVPRLQHIAPGF